MVFIIHRMGPDQVSLNSLNFRNNLTIYFVTHLLCLPYLPWVEYAGGWDQGETLQKVKSTPFTKSSCQWKLCQCIPLLCPWNHWHILASANPASPESRFQWDFITAHKNVSKIYSHVHVYFIALLRKLFGRLFFFLSVVAFNSFWLVCRLAWTNKV